MNLWNFIWIGVIWLALTSSPVQSVANNLRDKTDYILKRSSITTIKINPLEQRLNFFWEIDPEIEQELKNLNKIDFKKWLFPDQISIKEGENVYVLYPIETNNSNKAWILLHWIPYKKVEMKDFIVFMNPLKQWGYFQILVATDYKNKPENVDYSYVNILY
jgi:hypothetical protein